jgi:glutamate-1-semialdehyde 2,1-aminomutase
VGPGFESLLRLSVAVATQTDLIREYESRTPRSRELFARFRQHLPGGETRTLTYYRPYPVVIARGEGPILVDVDGNEYVDVLNNYTALVHGHAFPPIVEAIAEAARDGVAYPAPHPRQLRWAELLTERYPAVELVRFTNSGTEAAILAARVARRLTGRPRLLLFEGAYHGTGPEFAGEGGDVVRVPYGEVPELDDRVAAVFVEPFLGSGGVVEGSPEFLRGLREAARRAGAVFVLDEVQALRNAFHGVHDELGLEPDLILMGKIVGGGIPVGAVGGSRDVLGITAADGPDPLPHSGTFNGNPLAAAAGVACLEALDEDVVEALNGRAARLARRLAAEGAVVRRSGSIMQVDAPDPAALHLALLVEGVFAAPRGMLNLSTAMTDEHLEAIAGAYSRALSRARG